MDIPPAPAASIKIMYNDAGMPDTAVCGGHLYYFDAQKTLLQIGMRGPGAYGPLYWTCASFPWCPGTALSVAISPDQLGLAASHVSATPLTAHNHGSSEDAMRSVGGTVPLCRCSYVVLWHFCCVRC